MSMLSYFLQDDAKYAFDVQVSFKNEDTESHPESVSSMEKKLNNQAQELSRRVRRVMDAEIVAGLSGLDIHAAKEEGDGNGEEKAEPTPEQQRAKDALKEERDALELVQQGMKATTTKIMESKSRPGTERTKIQVAFPDLDAFLCWLRESFTRGEQNDQLIADYDERRQRTGEDVRAYVFDLVQLIKRAGVHVEQKTMIKRITKCLSNIMKGAYERMIQQGRRP